MLWRGCASGWRGRPGSGLSAEPFQLGERAYGETFWWAAGITALAIVPCIVLVRAERTARARGRGPDPGVTEEAIAESVA